MERIEEPKEKVKEEVLGFGKFFFYQLLFPELKRLIISYFSLKDLLRYDSAVSNRKELLLLYKFLRGPYTSSDYEFQSIESLRWIKKKLPRLTAASLTLPPHRRGDRHTFSFIAMTKGLEDIFELLIPGYEINAKDSMEMTALHHAAREGHVKNVKLLVQHGADINTQDIYGRTPVYLSCLRRNDTVYQYLAKECNADVFLRTVGGQNTLDVITNNAVEDRQNQWGENYWESIFVTIFVSMFFFWYYRRGWMLLKHFFELYGEG